MGNICSWTSNIKGFHFGQIWSFEGLWRPISFVSKLFPCRLHDKMWGIHIENTDSGHLPHSLHTSLRECLLHQGVAQACRSCNYPLSLSLSKTSGKRKTSECHATAAHGGTTRGRGRSRTDVTSLLRCARSWQRRKQHAAAAENTHQHALHHRRFSCGSTFESV